jgi:hypothetical protein
MSVIKRIDELIERGPPQNIVPKKSKIHQKGGKLSGLVRRVRKAQAKKKVDVCPTCGKKL